MEASALSKSPPKAVSIRVPKTKRLIAAGDAAGERYYREAGVELNQMKDDWEGPGFWPWAQQTFNKSDDQLRDYMELAGTVRGRNYKGSMRQTLRPDETSKVSWQAPVQEVVNRINVRVLAQERQNRDKEDKLQRQLAFQLIDIGYKVLATKLHPDKRGGSTEAFQRLKEVRDRLKGVYS